MKPTTLLLLSVSAGAGHVRAAQAIKAAAEKDFPGVRVEHIDVMDHVPKVFRKIYADLSLKILTHDIGFMGYVYTKTYDSDDDSRLARLRRRIENLNIRKVREAIEAVNPDAVLCTHFLPAQFMSKMIQKGTWTRPAWVQVTDYDIHGLWVVPGVTGYFAANDEVAFRMRDHGIEAGRVHTTGIPIMPVFGERRDRAECARELGLDPAKLTLLLMGGGTGAGKLDRVAAQLLEVKGDFQIVALAGRNEDLLESLRGLAATHPKRLLPLGFTSTIERVMTAGDVAVTKPGGLTTAECLAVGMPTVLVSAIPGHEERNATYMLENGAGWRAFDFPGLMFRLQRLIESPAILKEMRERAARLGRPHAARDVLAIVLGEGPGA